MDDDKMKLEVFAEVDMWSLERSNSEIEMHVKRRLYNELFQKWMETDGDYLISKPVITMTNRIDRIRFVASVELYTLEGEEELDELF